MQTTCLLRNSLVFRPGDSTIYQLLSITSTIYESFENFDETRAVFLDISNSLLIKCGMKVKKNYRPISLNLNVMEFSG